jgi:8-oxo-dGTP pyrophosphatase MutT (NUDIX family)
MDPRILGLPAGAPRFNTEICFHLEVSPEAQVRLALDEHTEYRWCGFEEARELMIWEGSKAALDLLGRRLCQPAR